MIDINTASADEIDALPQLKGHGYEIVRYRAERGRFEAVRQLEEGPAWRARLPGWRTPSASAELSCAPRLRSADRPTARPRADAPGHPGSRLFPGRDG
ncbi:helix-hairpin-helix domain-containing protein [Sphingomonas guangdongensis]|uniref:helix-hairpin-helix domain-containing protein n=1 Tax=Sphingomonas guangdongensis TaxID=1141890 RepID=UPI000BE460AB|nr:helix-hairpin-helix domain-containing protein [Sphingomonas guangdongensis]